MHAVAQTSPPPGSHIIDLSCEGTRTWHTLHELKAPTRQGITINLSAVTVEFFGEMTGVGGGIVRVPMLGMESLSITRADNQYIEFRGQDVVPHGTKYFRGSINRVTGHAVVNTSTVSWFNGEPSPTVTLDNDDDLSCKANRLF
jgi:hypothetical protein